MEQVDLFGDPIAADPPPQLPPDEPLEQELGALPAPTSVPEEQLFLFDMTEPWRIEWNGMPEFTTEDLQPAYSVIVHFESDGDVALFEQLVGQSIGEGFGRARSIWFPEAEIMRMVDKRYVSK